MQLTLTEVDRYRLERLRIARLVEVVPPVAGLLMTVIEQTLCIALPDNLLEVAAIALGTSQVELYVGEQILCRLSLESNSNTQDTTMTATLEREPQTTANDVISWRVIASSTGETEADIKRRTHSLGINFRWVGDDGEWGVLTQDAQVLASRYYIDMGNAIALSLGGGEQTTAPAAVQIKPEETTKEKRRSPKPPIDFKAEFKPTKNHKVTAERYLAAIAPEKDEQLQILHNIVTDAGVARRHLNKVLANMSADLKDSTTRAKLQAAFTMMHERVSKPSVPTETEKVVTEQE